MKNLLFIAAFLLASTFSFASNEKKSTLVTGKSESVISSKKKVSLTKIDKSQINTANAKYFSYLHMDSCGNLWEVDYWGMSYAESQQALWELDGFLCSTGGVGSYTFYYY